MIRDAKSGVPYCDYIRISCLYTLDINYVCVLPRKNVPVENVLFSAAKTFLRYLNILEVFDFAFEE